jgi:hypothetical protein
MTKLLITPTLLNSFAFYTQEIEYKSEEEQRQEFLQTLKRVKSEPTEAMQKGIDFEDDIKLYCETNRLVPSEAIRDKRFFWKGGYLDATNSKEYTDLNNKFNDYLDVIIPIANIVKGGLWQQTCKKELKIGNQEFLLYGKCDVIKADTIYDIKFTSNYDIGKYLNSSQHLIYLYCSGLSKFQYLISDGKSHWIEDYYNDSNIENNIKSKISEFIGYLENDKQAKTIYFENWRSK